MCHTIIQNDFIREDIGAAPIEEKMIENCMVFSIVKCGKENQGHKKILLKGISWSITFLRIWFSLIQ